MTIYFTIYKTTNLINNKIYIGKHQTSDLKDDYLGSGILLTRAIEKYGVDSFYKEILFVFDNKHDMELKEQEIVTEEFISHPNVYNLAPGGQGGKLHNWSKTSKLKLSKSLKKRTNDWGHKVSKTNTGRKLSKETKKKMSETRSNRGETKRLNKYSSCPHCKITTNLGNLARYHMDKCKSIMLEHG